jgi:hypothetical protein
MFIHENYWDRLENRILKYLHDNIDSVFPNDTNWNVVFQGLMIVLFVLSTLTCFARPDFYSLAILALGIIGE